MAQNEKNAAILEWFGIARTGGTVVVGPNGTTLPEYEVVDWEKFEHAQQDPYGYKNQTASQTARHVPWSTVKQLYREP